MKNIKFLMTVLTAFFCLSSVNLGGINTMTEAQAKEYRQVSALHILVPSEKEAADLRAEIMKGKTQEEVLNNFKAAAKKYSKCPSGAEGGDLGWFGRGMMVKEFEDAAFKLPSGGVSEPVKTQFGWHLIYTEAKK